MPELILHHFPASPFSEKLRLVLGYKQLHWQSVVVPNIMPKPDVVALTGGYRKTPFLQIGADIYCDTSLICDVLDRVQPAPPLYAEPGQAMARILAQWADTTLFWAALTYNRGITPAPPEAIYEDRKAMGFDVQWLRPADAATAYQTYVERLSDLLKDQPYLLGQRPCIADFCAYHPLWFVHLRATAAVDTALHTPVLTDWLHRMQAIGHGSVAQSDSAQAIALAAGVDPMPIEQRYLHDTGFQDQHGIALGSRVTISAESFGLEPSEGELVAATRTHYSLRRADERAGTVHVHFPRIGYVLKKQ